jgi:hypothetical protein
VAGSYHLRHPEGTVFFRVFFHHFERCLTEYEGRFEKEHGCSKPSGGGSTSIRTSIFS